MRRLTFALAVIALIATACSTGGTSGSATSTKRLTVALSHDPQSLDPMVDSSGETQNILHNIFDSLVVANDQLQQAGDLATSWKFAPPSSWDFSLRQGVKFQNGAAVTAEDIKYSFDRILDPANKSPMQSFITPIDSVSVLDAKTVRIHTTTPTALVPEVTKTVMIVPQKVVVSMGVQAFGQKPIGSGPYKVTEWLPNDHMTLQAFSGYWAGAAPITNLTLRPIPEASTRVAALETGQVDLISNFGVPFYAELKSHSNLRVVNNPESRTAEIILDTNPADHFPPFQDARVRQAVNEAIDYNSLIQQVMGGLAKRNCQPVTSIIAGYDPSIQCPTYNPSDAQSLLAAAGYPNGFTVSFGGVSGQNPGDLETEQAIVGMLGKVGIKVNLQVEEFGTWLDDYHHRKWPMVFHTNGTTELDADPDIFQLFYASTGRKYYSSPQMDQMIAAEENEFDPAKRLPLVQSVIKYATSNYLWVSVYNEPDLWAMNSNLNFAPRGDEWTVMTRASWKA